MLHAYVGSVIKSAHTWLPTRHSLGVCHPMASQRRRGRRGGKKHKKKGSGDRVYVLNLDVLTSTWWAGRVLHRMEMISRVKRSSVHKALEELATNGHILHADIPEPPTEKISDEFMSRAGFNGCVESWRHRLWDALRTYYGDTDDEYSN
jgi:hypothetical protein